MSCFLKRSSLHKLSRVLLKPDKAKVHQILKEVKLVWCRYAKSQKTVVNPEGYFVHRSTHLKIISPKFQFGRSKVINDFIFAQF